VQHIHGENWKRILDKRRRRGDAGGVAASVERLKRVERKKRTGYL